MKIVLVNPPCRAPTLMPLGLGYIASVLRQCGHDIVLLDLNALSLSQKELERKLADSGADVVGIGGLTTTYKFVKSFSSLVRKLLPEARIVTGNMVSTAYPSLILEHSDVDICVIDEGELTVQELMSSIDVVKSPDCVKGIAFKKDGHIVKTEPRERIEDLDALPYPAWDLFPMETYIKSTIHTEYGRRSLNVSAVRGCPFQCIYCSRPFGSRVYMRSPESVIREIEELKKRYRIEYVGFCDDLFMVDRKWLVKLCSLLIEKRLHVGWGSSARVNLVDPELLHLMKKAGCEMLSYGFESGSQKILDNMKKGVKVENSMRAIELTRKAGMKVGGSFMIGMIGETVDTVEETISFIKNTGLLLDRFFYTTPYPGTPLYEIAKKMGRISVDEDTYVSSLGEMCETLLVNLTDMANDELRNLKAQAEKKIKENFSLRTRLEILTDEMKRIGFNVKKRISDEGLSATLCWAASKITQRNER